MTEYDRMQFKMRILELVINIIPKESTPEQVIAAAVIFENYINNK